MLFSREHSLLSLVIKSEQNTLMPEVFHRSCYGCKCRQRGCVCGQPMTFNDYRVCFSFWTTFTVKHEMSCREINEAGHDILTRHPTKFCLSGLSSLFFQSDFSILLFCQVKLQKILFQIYKPITFVDSLS